MSSEQFKCQWIQTLEGYESDLLYVKKKRTEKNLAKHEISN